MAIATQEQSVIDQVAKQLYIGGEWRDASGGDTLPIEDPATGEALCEVANGTPEDARAALDAAVAKQAEWAATPPNERSAILWRAFEMLNERADDLALLMTLEMGKAVSESKAEIAYAAEFFRWFSGEALRIDGYYKTAGNAASRVLVMRQPVGPCYFITPWNFPNAMITRKVAPALAAGCTVVIKPSEFTPYSALALGVLAERAGIPAGVVNIVTGMPGTIGQELLAHETVRKISFTGSTRVGALLMRGAADSIKRLSLELGGNAPFIVFDDADLELAIEGVVASKFRNGGQTCVCANRILVQAGIHDAFAAKLSERVKAMKVGPGTEEGVAIGPMINAAAIKKIEKHVADATAKGGRILATSSEMPEHGQYARPVVIGEATTDMLLASEETFGPVAPLFRFQTEEEAIAIANGTPFGLAAYFYTESLSRSWRVGEGLEFGMVGLNTGAISTEVAPFGGVKQSGLGREGSHLGIEEYLEVKTFHMAGIRQAA